MRKINNTRTKSRRNTKKRNALFSLRGRFFFVVICFGLLLGIVYHYRIGLGYYLGFKSYKEQYEEAENKRFSDVRNFQVLEKHQGKAIGLDVSEFQSKIDWELVETIEGNSLKFVFIRATAGRDKVDRQFENNWLGVKNKKIIRGAYHYYRPNENSLEQAALFIKTVKLKKGDLPPVLDIEKLPKGQSIANLKLGLRRWLQAIEAHYKVKPIIYSGESYYNDFLKEDFSDYLFWIANYNFYREKIDEEWLFWQFTEKASVTGIKGNVDVNIFNGDIQQLQFITIE